jgi:hypothetical protein
LENKTGDGNNGCLRNDQAKAEGRKMEKQLNAYEWELCLKMRESMESAGDLTMHLQHNNTLPTAAFVNVWGVTKQMLNRKRKMVLEDPTLSTSRKKRRDAGKTILKDDEKRYSCLTAYNVYKKQKLHGEI